MDIENCVKCGKNKFKINVEDSNGMKTARITCECGNWNTLQITNQYSDELVKMMLIENWNLEQKKLRGTK